jgi:hypothetical protein
MPENSYSPTLSLHNYKNHNIAKYTWSLTLGLRLFENGLLRTIFGPKRNWVMRESKRVHNEEL